MSKVKRGKKTIGVCPTDDKCNTTTQDSGEIHMPQETKQRPLIH